MGGGRAEERRPCGSRSLKDAGGGGGGEGGFTGFRVKKKRNSEDAKSEGLRRGGPTGLWNRKDAKKMAARQCGKEIVPAERVCCHSPRLCAAGGWVQSLPLCHFAQAPRTPAQGRSIDIGDVHGMLVLTSQVKQALHLCCQTPYQHTAITKCSAASPPPPPKKGGGEVGRA